MEKQNHFENQKKDVNHNVFMNDNRDYELDMTSDGYQGHENQSIEDDIQNIIFQAQQAYANKQITGEELEMIKSNQIMHDRDEFKTHDGISHFDDELCLMPPNHISHTMGEKNMVSMQSTSKTNQMVRLDVSRVTNTQNKPQHHVLASPTEQKYIDTNHDNCSSNSDLNLHSRTKLPPAMQNRMRSLEHDNSRNMEYQEKKFHPAASAEYLPNQQQLSQQSGHNTGHFNSNVRMNHDDPQLARGASEPYIQTTQRQKKQQIQQKVSPRRTVSNNTRNGQKSNRSSQKSQSFAVMRNRGKSLGSDNSQNRNRSREIPQQIHSSREDGSLQSTRNQTIFSQQFRRLYDQIIDIYPKFASLQGTRHLPPLMQSNDSLPAQHVYSQISFLFNRCQEHLSNNQIVPTDKELSMIMNDQASTNNNMMRYQIENLERENIYYKKQMDVFKNQMEVTAQREQKSENQYEQRLKFLTEQVRNYEHRIEQLQTSIQSYEKETLNLRLSNIANNDRHDNNNISFRDTGNQSFKTPEQPNRTYAPPDQSMYGDNTLLVTQLQQEIRDLKSKLKMKEEMVGYEKEINTKLNENIDKSAEQYKREIIQHQKENAQLRLDNQQRIETIRLLNQQLDNFAEFTALEFPLLVGKNEINLPMQINLTNQKPGAKFVSMTGKQKKTGTVQDIEEQMEEIFNLGPFAGRNDDDDFKVKKNSQMPMRGKSTNNMKSPLARSHRGLVKKPQPNPMEKLFNIGEMVQTQISSVMIADEVIRDLQELQKSKVENIDKEMEYHQHIEEKVDQLAIEKKDFLTKQHALTKENEDLKVKFSQLLDQFQEYVNESEKRMEEDQIQQKEEQEKLLTELNNTISELQLMSQNLQNDVQLKEQQIERMDLEKQQLERDIEFIKEQAEKQDLQAENEQNQQIKTLNEEISYLKKHYMVEMDVLRQENKLLSIRNQKAIEQNDEYEMNRSHSQSPYLKNEGRSAGLHSQAQLQRRHGHNDSIEYQNEEGHSWQTPAPHHFNNVDPSLRLSRQKSQMVSGSEYTLPYGAQNKSQVQHFRQDIDGMFVEDQEPKNVRSKSYDRVVGQGERRRGHRHQRSRGGEMSNEHSRHNSRNRSYDPQNPGRAKELISGAQNTFDGLKREITDKDRLIEQKNREIVKLRMENDEYKSNFANVEGLGVSQQLRSKVLNDIDNIVETMRIELERTKLNLFKDDHHSNQKMLMKIEPQIELVTCEDKMIEILQKKIKDMRNLVSVAQEIFLLSSKQKYAQTQGYSPSKTTLQTDISQQVQRQLFQRDNNDYKSLSENQHQEIIKLQKDLDMLHRQIQENDYNQNTQNILQENRVLKQEINMLRENEARNNSLKNDNDELMSERRDLIQRLEKQEKESSTQISEAEKKIKERDNQLEELRSRITVIAELFEKKPIKQRYSFEVLCDFVHDKAKRLFNKYENAIKDKKSDSHYQRKVRDLENDLKNMQEYQNMLQKIVVPTVMNILNRLPNDYGKLNVTFIQGLMHDLEQYFKNIYEVHVRESEVISGCNGHMGTLSQPSHHMQMPPYAGPSSGYSNMVTMAAHTPSNINTLHTIKPPENFDKIRDEKNALNSKLDDFQKILTQFQYNQKSYEQENMQLKAKIGQLESNSLMTQVNYQGNSIGGATQGSGRNEYLMGSHPQSAHNYQNHNQQHMSSVHSGHNPTSQALSNPGNFHYENVASASQTTCLTPINVEPNQIQC